MNNAGAIMLEFLQSSAALGKLIHQDYNSAKKIFDEIKKTTNFTALIEQQKEDSNNFLKECKSFANSVERQSEDYIILLKKYQEILKYVIESISGIKGIKVSYTEEEAKITFNQQEFIFSFEQNYPHEVGTLQISPECKSLLAKQENKIVQEIADIISLNLHINIFLNYIVDLNTKYNLFTLTKKVKKVI